MRTISRSIGSALKIVGLTALAAGSAGVAHGGVTYVSQSRTLVASGGNVASASAPGFGPFNMSIMSTTGPFGQYGSTSQVSSMDFAAITCTANGYGFGGNQMQSGGGVSELHIHFTVDQPGPFHLTGGWDNTNYYAPSSSSMAFSDSTHQIASAGLFNILFLGQEDMGTFDIPGVLVPGTTYSLDIIANAGATGGTHTGHSLVYATLTVPAPGGGAAMLIGGMGAGMVGMRRRR